MVVEKEIQVFVDGIKHYFATVSASKAVVGTPYIINVSEVPYHDYVGMIEVSGLRAGKVYFSAAGAMLKHLLLSLGEKDIDSELILDIVGEVANTISGNVREIFGSQFEISVPAIYQSSSMAGKIGDANIQSGNAFIIPFRWKSYTGHLAICLV